MGTANEQMERLERLGVIPAPVARKPKPWIRKTSYPYQFDLHVEAWKSATARDAMVRDWLDLSPTQPIVTISGVIEATCKHYSISRIDLLSQRRTFSVMMPRQIAMYLAKTLTTRSLPEIGSKLGGRDHTTILHGVRKIDRLLKTDSDLAQEVATLTSKLTGGAHANAG